MTRFRILLLPLLLITQIFADEKISLATYNLLNYDNAGRDTHFRVVMDAMQPDLLVAQEVGNTASANNFLNNVLNFNRSDYQLATFLQSPFTSNALYYKQNKFTFVSNVRIPTDVRDINQFTIVYNTTDDTLVIYSLHLKAGSSNSDQQQRSLEIDLLRNVTDALNPQTNFIVAGDFNVRSSSEAAFQTLLEFNQGARGAVVDPINSLGNWNNNSSFSSIHSQSPRTTSFGGGSPGGLDDRFDMILISLNIQASGGVDYIPGSYRTFGNDGNHFNQAVNDGVNQDVPANVANALHEASDHLPVLLKLNIETPTSIAGTDAQIPQTLVLHQNYPNPFNPMTTIKYELNRSTEIELIVYNILGSEVVRIAEGLKPVGAHQIEFNAATLPSGIYYYQILNQIRKMVLMK